MSASEPERKVKTDEEWKDRVRREAEAERAGASPEDSVEQPDAPSGESPPIDASALPPPNIGTLISMFSTQAMVALGMLADPTSGKADLQPALARHFIDLLGVIAEKTKGNLTSQEEQFLQTALHELRMAFVQIAGGGKG